MCRANYDTLCEHWRTNVRSDCYKDVYDGKIWQDFQTYEGSPFLSEPLNLALMLNMDFF